MKMIIEKTKRKGKKVLLPGSASYKKKIFAEKLSAPMSIQCYKNNSVDKMCFQVLHHPKSPESLHTYK